ncbi:hypothetical protein [Hyalangium rubrum]|uniref:Uncharacterized protein n=1 Tax=Hyalangium rubrum TaxID=3103134 RepID=A0ABU5HHR6_9BACT|nr:hypothetical protein [Hyalangium sp. s54d21]MDY7232999.1 hypothetical protein [Hyalangium sp. s54d21]
MTNLTNNGVSSYAGEIAGNGTWAVSTLANALHLDYYVDGSLRASDERPGTSGYWYYSGGGYGCGSHSFEVRAYPMVIDSNNNRTVCWSSPMTLSQSVVQTCPTASLSCSRNLATGYVNCTGSGSGGEPSYQYQWNIRYSNDYSSWESGWFSNGTSYSEYCPRGFYVDAYYWNAQLQLRVVDFAGMSSTVVSSQNYLCVDPP